MTAIITGKKGHPTVFDLRSSSYMGTGCDNSAFAGKGRFVYSFQTVDAKNSTLLLNGVYLTLSSMYAEVMGCVDKPMVEHDVLNMTCVVEGVDQLKEQKESIGKAFSDVAAFTDASLVVNGVSVPRVSDAKCTPEAPQDKKYPIIYLVLSSSSPLSLSCSSSPRSLPFLRRRRSECCSCIVCSCFHQSLPFSSSNPPTLLLSTQPLKNTPLPTNNS